MTIRTADSEISALVLQGGGALGSYQAGVYQGLAEQGIHPNWISGISIGAINAAIIAGNPAETRLAKLQSFWDKVTSPVGLAPLWSEGIYRSWFNEMSAATVAMVGIPGFFKPRFPPPMPFLPGSADVTSYYDTAPLRQTLLDLVDFDLLNSGNVRLIVGAVNVLTGNFVEFDTARQRIGPEHIMASGALPPGFPPVHIDGQPYWDGGIVSNTPLQSVLDRWPRLTDLCVFQVDLFNARGEMPRNISEAIQREKDIRFSSRTRLNTDHMHRLRELRAAALRLLDKLPPELRNDPDVSKLASIDDIGAVTVMHLINRNDPYQSSTKDYEFSRATMEERWARGRGDVTRSLESAQWRNRTRPSSGFAAFDLSNAA